MFTRSDISFKFKQGGDKIEKLVEELDLETEDSGDKEEKKESDDNPENKAPTSVGLKENLANSGADKKASEEKKEEAAEPAGSEEHKDADSKPDS